MAALGLHGLEHQIGNDMAMAAQILQYQAKQNESEASNLFNTRLIAVLELAELAVCRQESAHCADVFRWAEAGLQQSYRVQILNPLTVGHITLEAGDGLQRMRVDQIPLKPRSSRI